MQDRRTDLQVRLPCVHSFFHDGSVVCNGPGDPFYEALYWFDVVCNGPGDPFYEALYGFGVVCNGPGDPFYDSFYDPVLTAG